MGVSRLGFPRYCFSPFLPFVLVIVLLTFILSWGWGFTGCDILHDCGDCFFLLLHLVCFFRERRVLYFSS